MNKNVQLALALSQQFSSYHYEKLNAFFSKPKKECPLALLQKLNFSQKQQQTLLSLNLKANGDAIAWLNQAPMHHILYYGDKNYPTILYEMAKAPLVLFASGQLSLLDNEAIAIVGSRVPTPPGCDMAKTFARQLAEKKITVISGLARGIDGCAHLGAIDEIGKTIAVLGSGLNQIYPKQHQKLADDISQKGLLLSSYGPNEGPKAHHFPQRNHIICGLSLGVLVVEAALKSGSLITARAACQMGREVFAIPGSIYNPLTRGTHQLIKEGAKLTQALEDILEEFSWQSQSNLGKKWLKPQKKLEKHLQNLVEFVGYEATAVDLLLAKSGLALDDLLSYLVELELSGHIKPMPGGYIRV